MHVLTKIFIVLVALLAVALTPLVVVYASNENTFRTRWVEAQAAATAATSRLAAAQESFNATRSRLDRDRDALESDLAAARRERDEKDASVRRLDAELAQVRSQQTSLNAQLATLAAALRADSELKEVLVAELRSERDKALAAERRFIEIDEKLRKSENDLLTLEAARRDLQEQLRQVMDEKQRALTMVNRYVAIVGALPDTARMPGGGVAPDRNLTAAVLNVRRSADQVLAEIDAGSRDGVREGWVMMLADGGNFLGNLRITKVDVNRSTGVVELEDRSNRGEVRPGSRAIARIGG
ncbi:MAG TPA: hypothetical protein PKC43_09960 [Phycisphaerales bacterium]|nr:hypothetical protein [Phycisphaerales bacterium]HMP37759.1 hypothetical protein [Phycisphaerales bacterium]